MSSDSNAELITTYKSIIWGGYATYAMTALVCYEHLITFKYEFDFLWRHKWSAATWIFVCNRYMLLASVSFQSAPAIPRICRNAQSMNTVEFFTAGALPVLPIDVFTILRTFALLQNYSWRLAAVLILSAATLVVFTLDSYVGFQPIWTYIYNPVLGSLCLGNGYSVPESVINRLDMVISVIGVTTASFVLALTLMKTVRQVQRAARLGLKTTLSETLLRDGSLYFFIVLVQDLVLAMPRFNGVLLNGPVGYVTTPIFGILPNVLLSRFIINLRQVDSPSDIDTSADQHTSHLSILNFRMPTMGDIVGNLGEPLDFAVEYRLEDENYTSTQDESANSIQDAEQKGAASTYNVAGAADVEAADPLGSGDGSADADVLAIDGRGLEFSPALSGRG